MVQIEGSKGYLVLSNPADSDASSEEPRMVFHRYGDQYFLARISTQSAGHDFPMSRKEREVKETSAAARQVRTEFVLAMR